MSNVPKYKIVNLLEEIKHFDKLLKNHEHDDDFFSIDQYQARKIKLTKDLIKLILPISDTKSILFIKQFLDKYYPYTITVYAENIFVARL